MERRVFRSAFCTPALMAASLLLMACPPADDDEDGVTPSATPTEVTPTMTPTGPTPTMTPEVTPTQTPVATPTMTPTPTEVPVSLEDAIRGELFKGRWSDENYEKLVQFLVTYSELNPSRPRGIPVALFDADKTLWGGDLGEHSFAWMVLNLKLDPNIASLFGNMIEVPDKGFGLDTKGKLFARARLEESQAMMLSRYQALVDSGADMAKFFTSFQVGLMNTGNQLDDVEFKNAYRVFTGTMVGFYILLDTVVGAVGFDYADVDNASAYYPSYINDFYAYETTTGKNKLAKFYADVDGDSVKDILFPYILDGGPNQATLQAESKLGSYTQVALWEAMGRFPADLEAIATDIFATTSLDEPVDAVFPVDTLEATSPVPLDYTVDPTLFEADAVPVTGVTMGNTAFEYGTALRPEIVSLVSLMQKHDITPVVITASEEDLVRAIATQEYGFHPDYIRGIQPASTAGGPYINELTEPVTYRPGKVLAAMDLMSTWPVQDEPYVVVFGAGDSNTDFEFVAWSADCRVMFDRDKDPLMELADWLTANGYAGSTVIQTPFED